VTNLEYLIACLRDEIDDGGASYEAAVHYNIACPHFCGEKVLPCDNEEPSRKLCVPCKMKWLKQEVSDNG
jgi:hypothetical protein